MNSKTILFSIALAILSIQSCSTRKPDFVGLLAEEKNVFLYGPVKEATSSNTYATTEYGGTATINYRTDDLGFAICKYEFDEYGNITAERFYNSKEDYLYGTNYICEYNKDHTLKTKSVHTIFYGEPRGSYRNDYEYRNGKTTKIVSTFPEGMNNITKTIEYDKGRISKITAKNSGAQGEEVTTVQYKKNYLYLDNNESMKVDLKTGRVIEFYDLIEVDKTGLIISCKNAIASEFDFPTPKSAMDQDFANVFYKYVSFDEYNNWTERITYLGEARIAKYVTKRTITYYK